jgi:hypothetical protein
MFLVRDTINERHRRIRRFLDSDDASIGVLLAAADFERTIRRAILGLGSETSANIKSKISRLHGLDRYEEGWNKEVRPRFKENLDGQVIKEWKTLKKAFDLRHELIHGTTRKPSTDFASAAARRILDASQQVHDFAAKNNVDLDKTIRRYKAKTIP